MAGAKWEVVSDDGGVSTQRLPVEGGWLYRVVADGTALAFVPGSGGHAAADQKTEHEPRVDD